MITLSLAQVRLKFVHRKVRLFKMGVQKMLGPNKSQTPTFHINLLEESLVSKGLADGKWTANKWVTGQ